MGGLLSCARPRNDKRVAECVNKTNLGVSIWINSGGPFAVIPPNGKASLNLKHVCGEMRWHATTSCESRLARVLPGVVASCKWRAYTVSSGTLNVGDSFVVTDPKEPVEGTLNLEALMMVTDLQILWRSKQTRRKEERARKRATAAVVLQRFARGRLARKLTTCFVCLAEIPFAAKVSTVPSHKCHRTCRACAKQYVDSAIADGKLYVRCPGEGCKHLMDPELFASRGALTKYRESMRTSHNHRLLAESDKTFVDFCKQHARACPTCGVLIWRYAGCDHMRKSRPLEEPHVLAR